jgi:uncharacterized protein
MIDQIADGRTDLVFDYLAAGQAAQSKDSKGTSLIEWCAYYGDVTAIKPPQLPARHALLAVHHSQRPH